MSKHRASYCRAPRRRRISALALAIGVTIAVGGAAVGVLPQFKNSPAAAAVVAARPAAIETAALTTLEIPKPRQRSRPRPNRQH